jgi:hypothetical protein
MAKNLSSILRGTNYGTLPISSGGTGVTSAVAALTALGAQAILPAANGSANGYLTSTDWTTFNSKLSSYTLPTAGASTLGGIKVGTGLTIDINGILTTTNSGTVTSVAGTAPIASSGGATPTISIAAATTSVSGYLTSTDWNTFNSKQAALSNASTSVSGILTSTDWNTFNSKQAALVSATNIKTVNGTTLLGSGDLVISGGASATKTIVNKTAAYTVVAGDLGKIINCTSGAFTVSLTAAATLGAGFTCTIWNTSNTATDAITIDPNLAETIDGIATLILRRGEGLDIVCDGTNWQINNKKPMRGYAENLVNGNTRAIASADSTISIGENSSATATYAIALGRSSSATGSQSIALGGYNCAASGFKSIGIGNFITASGDSTIAMGLSVTASSLYSAAIGNNSAGQGSVTATGAGAMALGGSYASGGDSFAASVANNTSSYGATGANATAIGQNAKSTGNSLAISAPYFGGAVASSQGAVAIGGGVIASGMASFAAGAMSQSTQYGKYAYAGGNFSTAGDAQFGKMVLRGTTINATPKVITSDAGAASTANQVVLPNQGVFTFSIFVSAVRTVGEGAGWKFEGVILRTGAASGTSIVDYTKTVLGKTTASWDCNISADTTNGALAVTVTGAASSTMWVAVVNTTEVIGA